MHEDLVLSRRTLLAGMGVTLAAMPFNAPFAFAESVPSWANVTRMIEGYVSSRKVPEMIAALGWGNTTPTYIARGHEGFVDSDPVGPDSLFRLYSMTKPVTGMAAMILIDEGKMSLDQPVADILPKFAKMLVQVTPDGSITDLRPAARPMTIRNLLTHTSGLGYTIIQKGPLKTAMEDKGVIAGQISRMSIPGLDRGKPVQSLELFADRLSELPLVYDPGERFSYSLGLDLMGRVIEVVAGQPFDAFLQERILGPTGMASTWFEVPEDQEHRLTTNYAIVRGNVLPIDPADASIYTLKPPFPMGGAGLVSSARDYDRFLMMLGGNGMIEGRRVISERAVSVGTSNLLPQGAITAGTMINGSGFGAGGRVGLGVTSGTFGWGGAAGTVAFVDMKRGLRAALYTQYMPSSAYPVQEEFPKAVVADIMARAAA